MDSPIQLESRLKCETKQKVSRDRRAKNFANKFYRFIYTWIVDTELETVEKIMFTFQAILFLAIFVLNRKLIPNPPPYLQAYILTLPAWAWMLLLATGVTWQNVGIKYKRTGIRRNGAVFSMFIIFSLCGPLYLKGPGMMTVTLVIAFWQAIVAGRIWKLYSKTKPMATMKK